MSNLRPTALDAARLVGLAAGVAAVVIGVDALTKWAIVRELGPGGSRSTIDLAGNFVQLHYALNSGVAFGLLNGNSALAGALVAVVIVPLIVVLVLLAGRGPLWAVASGLVLGGAGGNLLDRVGDGTVTDFISVGRWPSFNIADASITVGAVALIALSLDQHRTDSRSDRTAPQ
jgi:signal peptidase II